MATKKELAASIVSEFPDRGHDEEKLVSDNTHGQLTDLLSSLRAEDSEPSSQEHDAAQDAASDEAEQKGEQSQDTPEDATEKVLYQLADPSKHYHSRLFNIKGTEQKPLPDKIDEELARRIRAGYLVEVGD